jgi:hypothetical protein
MNTSGQSPSSRAPEPAERGSWLRCQGGCSSLYVLSRLRLLWLRPRPWPQRAPPPRQRPRTPHRPPRSFRSVLRHCHQRRPQLRRRQRLRLRPRRSPRQRRLLLPRQRRTRTVSPASRPLPRRHWRPTRPQPRLQLHRAQPTAPVPPARQRPDDQPPLLRPLPPALRPPPLSPAGTLECRQPRAARARRPPPRSPRPHPPLP